MDPSREEIETLRATIRDLRARVAGLSLLEDRVRLAEERAVDAERQLQELIDRAGAVSAPPAEAPATDLRSRLARTASRKKPGNQSDP